MAARQRRVRRLRGGRDSAGRKDGGGCEAEGPEWGPWGVARNHSLIWRTTMAGQRGGVGRVARSPRGVFPNGGLQGYLDTRRANLAKTSSFWIHGADVLPLRGVISVRGLLENTWRSLIAMVRHCRMHCAPFDSRLARRCSAERRRGRKTLAPRVRPATMTAASAGNRGTVEQRRRCPPEVASLLGGIGAIR